MKQEKFEHLGQDLAITYLNCCDLQKAENNPRTHSQEQLKQLANSIVEFGFTNPILIDQENTIIAGHGRLEAAKSIKLDKVPVIRLEYLTEAQRHAYMIADNKLAENAGWDLELLHKEMSYISELDVEFDLSLTGFEISEIDLLLENNDDEIEPATPDLPENPVTQIGDLWFLGHHKILCADSTALTSYKTLMGGDKANMVFTDPPYNVPVNGHICGKGQNKHDEFQMASGEMSEQEFTEFLQSIFMNLQVFSSNGSQSLIRIRKRT